MNISLHPLLGSWTRSCMWLRRGSQILWSDVVAPQSRSVSALSLANISIKGMVQWIMEVDGGHAHPNGPVGGRGAS